MAKKKQTAAKKKSAKKARKKAGAQPRKKKAGPRKKRTVEVDAGFLESASDGDGHENQPQLALLDAETPPPSYLMRAYPETALDNWRWAVGVLRQHRLASPLDIFELVILVEAFCQADVYRRLCFPNEVIIESARGGDRQNPILVRLEVAMSTIHKVCCKFGLNPVDRLGRELGVPVDDEDLQGVDD